jgi:hypothetical protein
MPVLPAHIGPVWRIDLEFANLDMSVRLSRWPDANRIMEAGRAV